MMQEHLTLWDVRRAGEDIPVGIIQAWLDPKTCPAHLGKYAWSFNLGDTLGLIGYKANFVADIDALEVTSYWHSPAPVDESHKTFLHLPNSEGAMIAQGDVLPIEPFSLCWPGNRVALC